MRLPIHLPKSPPRLTSMRSRLVVWYGALLALALLAFGGLTLLLVGSALAQQVDSSIRAETRVATIDLAKSLAPTPPYWPTQLHLQAVDSYREPGVDVTVVDGSGRVHYSTLSAAESAALLHAFTQTRGVLQGETVWGTLTVSGESVRVEGVPVRIPPTSAGAASAIAHPAPTVDDDGALTQTNSPILGALIVSKSQADVAATMQVLRGLVILTGIVTLIGGLLGGWLIATNTLRPLHAIGKTAQTIAQRVRSGGRLGGLQARVPVPRREDEVAQLAIILNDMLAALDRATETQQRFVADASHELRAPLTTIQGNLAFLARHAEELSADDRQAMLGDAHSETLRLARLVDDLLLLARADADTTQAHLYNMDETPTVEEATNAPAQIATSASIEWDHTLLQLIRQLRNRLTAEGSRLRIEVGQIEPSQVRADEETVRRIALILLDNAIKYTSAAGGSAPRSGRITVSLRHEAEHGSEGGRPGAALTVQDTGIGIDADDLPHVFERFYRADRARSREGTGLGLSIAHTLVERLGGHISVESAPGEGSAFRVWLPLVERG